MSEKNNSNKTLIERYIYAVNRTVPASQRQEISKEVRSVIGDMLTDLFPGKEEDPESIESVLEQLGDPSEMADRYMNRRSSYLIGPGYYHLYVMLVKIIIPVAAGAVLLAMVIKGIFEPSADPIKYIGEVIAAIINSALMSFAWLTGIFILAERFSSDRPEIPEKEEWSIKDLPEIPREKAVIKKSEPVIASIFLAIILVILNLAPGIIGIISSDPSGTVIIPVFNMNNFSSFLPVFNLLLLLAFGKEVIRFFEGRYTLRSSIAIAIIGIASIVILFTVFKAPALWNQDIGKEIGDLFDLQESTFKTFTEKLFPAALAVAVIGFVIETTTNFYRSIRYS